ncbi:MULTISPECIES: hypothetical protein [unclassified Corallococcus]|uniref:hypothetical protein n=1 Tax=unclassified Corallococcus TaxID=2685029 RepID=UPI001A90B25C|nr:MULTISPECIES: hypothetical protein [unclassified Corallococcus]MBN9685382.1 hypothetical protein [Corallococcus sp. NCSPR001]WAS83167.1 hypothetical protein O0N60_28080 [Corallococcus sp. NCRR]
MRAARVRLLAIGLPVAVVAPVLLMRGELLCAVLLAVCSGVGLVLMEVGGKP